MVVFTTAVAVGWKILEGGVCGAISAGVTYCGLKSCHPQQSPDGKQGAQKVDKQVDALKICHYQSPDGKQGEQKYEKQIDTPAVEQREVFLAPAPSRCCLEGYADIRASCPARATKMVTSRTCDSVSSQGKQRISCCCASHKSSCAKTCRHRKDKGDKCPHLFGEEMEGTPTPFHVYSDA